MAMAMQQTIGSSSSSSSSVALEKFDVFISFRGEDTRRKFTSHLNDALKRSGIRTFIDDSELEKGGEISSALIKAIEESSASIVIFSKDYASSKWCLNELVKILECKKGNGQIVIPIFYEIDPSDVRHQIGSYGQAFEKHKQNLKYNKDMLQKWKDALFEAATLSGWDSKNSRIESDFIKEIVKDVLKQLNHRRPIKVNKKLVGIEKKYEEIESLKNIGSNDVRTLGLWGMGGIGKTTLAKSLYAKHRSQFEYHCFLKNVRELSTECGLKAVRYKLYSTLLKLGPDAPYVETTILKRRLERAKCFIVLDDVATLEQAEYLNIGLGPGSRVIVTTRDKKIFSQFDECEIYEVGGLNRVDSLQLFCWNAFRKKHAEVGYEELSESAVGYCSGNPLALKVLGANLHRKSQEAWESELEKIKEIPDARILKVLKLSLIDLDRTQQDIFLDIACFFCQNINEFACYSQGEYIIDLFNACEFYPATGIEVLLHKALIAFRHEEGSHFPTIEMHDLLVEMGREIVKQKYPKNPGSRSRLWDPKEIYQVFKYNKGTDAVEVILFDTSEIGDLSLSSKSFESMINLRLLHITNKCNNVHLPAGLEWLFDKLRYLYWESFPLESLPSTFCGGWLVQLSMTHSKLKKLWDGIQKLDNLAIIQLFNSRDLIEIPDLSKAPNLKLLCLSYCVSLRQLHPSIFTAPKLRELHLQGCKKIESLKTNIHSKSLTTLTLFNCSSLVEFSSSTSLRRLDLSGCTQINTLNIWFILDGAPSLVELYLNKCCNLETLPDNIQNCLMLETLSLNDCENLKSLAKLPASLRDLRAMNCTYLDTNSIQGEILENMFHRLPIKNYEDGINLIYLLPAAKVPREFDFYTREASVVLPPIKKSGSFSFVFCVILSEGLNLTTDEVCCTIYDDGVKVVQWDRIGRGIASETLISDHVFLVCWSWLENDYFATVDNDHYTLSFELKVKHYVDGGEQVSTKAIKGCGVIPLYDLEHGSGVDGSTSSKVEIVELPFNAQVSSDEFHVDDNEDAQQQLLPPKKRNRT